MQKNQLNKISYDTSTDLTTSSCNYFCDTTNNIETVGKGFSAQYQTTMFFDRIPTEKGSDILFGSEYKREI